VIGLYILGGAVLASMAFLLLAATYLVLQTARERKADADAELRRPLEADLPPDDEDRGVASDMLAYAAEAGRSAGAQVKDEWIAEKLSEGWSEEDVGKYLESRPLLELD